jgi:hypothetical protein
LPNIPDEQRALMDAFVGQSLVASEESSTERVSKALFRIGNSPMVVDSPLREGVFLYKQPQRGEFSYDGKMVATDGERHGTKLTKIFKRRDNEGKLLNALRRMRLN